jgi:hypothetical protein
MNIEKQAQDWVNDGDWGHPVDQAGQWMFNKLVEAYKAGYEAASEQLHLHNVSGSVCPSQYGNVPYRVFNWDSTDLYKGEQTDR